MKTQSSLKEGKLDRDCVRFRILIMMNVLVYIMKMKKKFDGFFSPCVIKTESILDDS